MSEQHPQTIPPMMPPLPPVGRKPDPMPSDLRAIAEWAEQHQQIVAHLRQIRVTRGMAYAISEAAHEAFPQIEWERCAGSLHIAYIAVSDSMTLQINSGELRRTR